MTENQEVRISICIPAYKRAEFLKRLLDSILIQKYRNFEVIVTDDSPDDAVHQLCEEYKNSFVLKYYKNKTQLGTPENWNEAIRKASGLWIKLMHDDDWFSNELSLLKFSQAAENGSDFIFSAYRNYFQGRTKTKEFHINWFRRYQLINNPATLFSENVIGAPSVTMFKKGLNIDFDKSIKWVVDIDFYIQVLKITHPIYIDQVLINVGLGDEQVTKVCFRIPEVEIPENFHLLGKTGIKVLKNVLVYDAWWRILRNLNIKSLDDIKTAGYTSTVHEVIKNMIFRQNRIPKSILLMGVFSKFFMALSYFFDYKKIK